MWKEKKTFFFLGWLILETILCLIWVLFEGFFFCTLFIFMLLPTILEALHIGKSLLLILLKTLKVNMCIKIHSPTDQLLNRKAKKFVKWLTPCTVATPTFLICQLLVCHSKTYFKLYFQGSVAHWKTYMC